MASGVLVDAGFLVALLSKRDAHHGWAARVVRMSETLADPLLLTTDDDFRVYRRHGRQVVPAALP